jgi:hypothetical protein
MARPRTRYLIFDVDGWLLVDVDTDKSPVTVAWLSDLAIIMYPNELARDLQFRRLTFIAQDVPEDRDQITQDRNTRLTHQNSREMTGLVGGELVQIRTSDWVAEMQARYPDMFSLNRINP